MKRTGLILLLLLLTSFSFSQKAVRDICIAADRAEYSFGEVPDNVGEVSHTFFLKNSSDKPVVIDRTDTSCSCTRVVCKEKVIRPGKEIPLTVTFNPIGLRGRFRKRIIVRTDNLRKYVGLTITGDVVAPKF